MLTTIGVPWRRWDLRSSLRYLSPHAIGLTPGLQQVPVPFASLLTLTFPNNVVGRQVSRFTDRVSPSLELSQLYPFEFNSRSCTIRFMLRPAALASPPDWVQLAFLASLLGTLSEQVQPACYHANPLPAYIPKRAICMVTSSQITR